MELTLKDLTERLEGVLHGDGELLLHGVAGIKDAQPGEITFLADRKFEEWLDRTQASALILPIDHPFDRLPAIRVVDPRAAFRRAMEVFDQNGRPIPAGVHPSAVIGRESTLGEEIAIGANVVIGNRCRLGDRVTVLPGAVIGDDVEIGDECLIYPNVIIWKQSRLGARVILHSGVVIGDDGFGFLTRDGRHEKIPQLGHVEIEDDVDIGANTCVDRATTGVTRIGQGTRVDNLVQIAHNVAIGEDAILCAQVGIAGSTSIGNRVTLAGQAGVVGHIEIGDQVMVGAQGGVTKSVMPGAQVSGYPATRHALAQRMYAALRNLPELVREVRRLRERIRVIEERERPVQ